MDRMIGWVVKAKDGKDKKSKFKIVSGPLQTRSGANAYKQLYQKSHSDEEIIIEQRVIEDRL